jgi:HD-GYP domain-containing protein (c-di-GMP phosphodiesterase class II)
MKIENSQWIESVELVQIDVKDLKTGMFVSRLDRPWLESNFLLQGFELINQLDIEAVQKQCDFVFIDTTRQTKVSRYAACSTAYTKDYLDNVQPRERRSTFGQEIEQAEAVHQKTSTLVKSFMEEVQFGRTINAVAAKEAVANCVDSILNSPDALMLMTQLRNQDEYTAQHSMNVCIYAIALGRHINLSIEELNNVGMCGMMHDMGKMLVPTEVLNKPGRLTPEELVIMRSHTKKGWEILLNTPGMYGGAIDVAYLHHERLDGNGYPRKFNANQITPFAKIVAIVDMFDALSSNRVYQKGRPHLEAIKILTESSSNGHLDSALTMKFIECIGIYPAGSIVELVSGELAIVLEIHSKAKLKPTIMILQDENKKPCNEHVVDLSIVSQNANGDQYRIRSVLQPDVCGIDLAKYYQSGILKKALGENYQLER